MSVANDLRNSTAEFVPRPQLAERLTAAGFPISNSRLSKICAPSSGISGPPVAYWLGRRPIYNVEEAIAWARYLASAKREPSKIDPHRQRAA
jgi:hypothetical protein